MLDILVECIGITAGDVDDFIADIDAVVAVHLPDAVECHDVGAVHAEELRCREHFLHCFIVRWVIRGLRSFLR